MKYNIPKVSVVVPVYNVEKYIERCARSLFEQTLDDIEYIFVNDCTQDNSMELLQEIINDYPERKHATKYINHKWNQGSAAVRNTGVEAATGKYVIFCDSDDWVEPDMYEAMYCMAEVENADVVGTDFYNEYASHSTIQLQKLPNNNIECIRLMLSGNLHCGTWNKLVRRDIYIQNNIHFPDGINLWEDVLTMIPVFFYASKIVYLHQSFYHYVRDNNASYTNNMKESSLQNLMEAVNRIEYFLKEQNLSQLKTAFCYQKLTVKLNLLLNSRGQKQQMWNKLYPETSPFIWSYSAISFYWRIALKLSSWNCLPVFNLMVSIRKNPILLKFFS